MTTPAQPIAVGVHATCVLMCFEGLVKVLRTVIEKEMTENPGEESRTSRMKEMIRGWVRVKEAFVQRSRFLTAKPWCRFNGSLSFAQFRNPVV